MSDARHRSSLTSRRWPGRSCISSGRAPLLGLVGFALSPLPPAPADAAVRRRRRHARGDARAPRRRSSTSRAPSRAIRTRLGPPTAAAPRVEARLTRPARRSRTGPATPPSPGCGRHRSRIYGRRRSRPSWFVIAFGSSGVLAAVAPTARRLGRGAPARAPRDPSRLARDPRAGAPGRRPAGARSRRARLRIVGAVACR